MAIYSDFDLCSHTVLPAFSAEIWRISHLLTACFEFASLHVVQLCPLLQKMVNYDKPGSDTVDANLGTATVSKKLDDMQIHNLEVPVGARSNDTTPFLAYFHTPKTTAARDYTTN